MTIEPADHDPRPAPRLARAATDDHTEVRYTVLSRRAIAVWAVLIIAAGLGVAAWLLLAYGTGDARLQLDAIRTAGTLVVGAGGAAALLLAARRQRSTEIALKQTDRDQLHQERVAAATEADAAERRITELYTNAVEQLGSTQAPVRLGGMYALERVAQNTPAQRQTVVNVLCAYLRMPYTPPSTSPRRLGIHRPPRRQHARRGAAQTPTHGAGHAGDPRQELEVRLTAQRILAKHLHPGPEPATSVETFWEDIGLDLTGATLVHWNMRHCRVHAATFVGAQFSGGATFVGAQFTGEAQFSRAQFIDPADFHRAQFATVAWFSRTQFSGDVVFDGARFSGDAMFNGAQFTGYTVFRGAQFSHDALFEQARFTGTTRFDEAQFTFPRGRFTGTAAFDKAAFDQGMPAEIAALLQELAIRDDASDSAEPNSPGSG